MSAPPSLPTTPKSEKQPAVAAAEQQHNEDAVDAVPPEIATAGGEEEEIEEEQGECGFCLFMKGGGCKESFIAWENCIEEAEEKKGDIAEKCFELTSALRTCMLAHPDYYEPILRAEKAAEEEAVKELDKEKEAAASEKAPEKDKEEEVVIEFHNEKAAEEKSSK